VSSTVADTSCGKISLDAAIKPMLSASAVMELNSCQSVWISVSSALPEPEGPGLDSMASVDLPFD